MLNFSVSISEASVKRILKNSPNLECLELTGNVLYLTGNCFQKCSDGLKVLKVANQNGLLPEHLQVKLQHLSNWDGRYVSYQPFTIIVYDSVGIEYTTLELSDTLWIV